MPVLATSHEGMIIERRQRAGGGQPERVFAEVERIGGRSGWPYANVLWRVRGLMDRFVGGVGMRLGRRDPASTPGRGRPRLLAGGGALRRPELLRLRAEMRVPGRAWLQYEVVPAARAAGMVQTAFFEPKGLPGIAYWYVLYPVHGLIFRGMVRVLAARAERPAPVEPERSRAS